jgi:hypothetical protein
MEGGSGDESDESDGKASSAALLSAFGEAGAGHSLTQAAWTIWSWVREWRVNQRSLPA